MITEEKSNNERIRKEIGIRLKSERLQQNMTQATLADNAGISRRTLVGAERGEPFTIDTLLSILRVLSCLNQMEHFLPDETLSPIQLAKLNGHQRKRASGKFTYPMSVNKPWVWRET